MYKGKYILALIPARGGSKGIPNKNIRPLLGKPLIAYTINAAIGSKVFDRIIISTDSPEIKKVSLEYGAEVPFMRPKNLAQDNTPMIPVIQHALKFLKGKENIYPDIIVLLQPTSPLRKPEHIRLTLDKFLKSGADSVITVCETRQSPYSMLKFSKDKISYFTKDAFTKSGKERYTRRQDLPKVYISSGAVYITRPDIITRENKILGQDTRAVIMKQEDSIDVDTLIDFKLAELILREAHARD